jgi:serine/threonine protein kinase
MLQPGTILDRKYRVEAVLGRGGFGHVYRTRELLTGETVAVKELVSGLAEDPQAVRRFLQEARATLRLTHPHIARTYSVFQEGGTYYLAMEYLPGGSLADRLQRGPLAADQAVRVALDLCAALEYAHRSGVVHCDLKPANVLFDEAGRARLADFGIAHVSQQMMSQAVFTGTGMTMGTLRYMAPEQLEGVRDDPRLDLYALGALLYEMLAGQPYLDFEAETTPAAQMRNMARIQREAPRPLQAVNPSLPAWLVEIVERALRKAPGERFPTARALGEALQRGPSGRSTRGVAPAGPTRQPETHRRPERSRAAPASRAPGGARSAGRVPPAPKRRSGTRPILWLLAIGAGLAVLTLGALLCGAQCDGAGRCSRALGYLGGPPACTADGGWGTRLPGALACPRRHPAAPSSGSHRAGQRRAGDRIGPLGGGHGTGHRLCPGSRGGRHRQQTAGCRLVAGRVPL